jgi:hypothetical protein
VHPLKNHLRSGTKVQLSLVALAICASTLLTPRVNAQYPQQASSADSFVNSIGVGTHMNYANTPYLNNWPQVFADLKASGIRHIRDGYFDPNWGGIYTSRHQQLVQQAGILTNYVINYNPGVSAQSIEQLSRETGDMELLEAPNECDLPGGCGAGTSQTQSLNNMIAYLPMIQQAGAALNVPVLGPSFAAWESYSMVGNISSLMTYNNMHFYFGGRNPGHAGWGGYDANGNSYGTFPFWADQGQIDAPGVPEQITETGYQTTPGQLPQYWIPANVEAQYIARTYFLAYLHGFGRTYVYEFLDDPDSPNFGMIDGNLNPRPVYYEVKNLIGALADPGPYFAAGQLPYSVVGGDQTLNRLLLQKRDGSFWLILWLEQSAYDSINEVWTPVAPQQVTLTLGGNYFTPNIGTFDDNGNLNWVSTQNGGPYVPLTISDHPTIVKILP